MKKYTYGSISILVLVMAVVFGILLGGMALFGGTQFSATLRDAAGKRALMIAEAGVHYYRWHLAHDPDDYQDGTGLPGPYVHEYSDSVTGKLGSFSLSITPPNPGSSLVEIRSTGEDEVTGVRRTIRALYGRPSLAQYAFLHHASAWFGTGMTINGRVRSNGGIRMDGYNLSTVESAKTDYICGSETGCAPSTTQPGVWGSGGPSELWSFPTSTIDFEGIGVNFDEMKSAAIADTTYFGPSGSQGYHFEFRDDGTVRVYRVNNTNWRQGYSLENGCSRLYERMGNKTLLATHTLDEEKVFFAEDTVWVSGVVEGRATVAAARMPLNTNQTSMWIADQLVYAEKDGSSALGLVAANNIYIPLDISQIFEINAAMLAQDGRVMRHHYALSGCSNSGSAVRDELIVYGSIISYQQATWNWGSGPSSGFVTRNISYDTNLFLSPPPYFPAAPEYEFLSWDEVDNP